MSSLKRLSTLFLTLLLTMALCIPAMANDTLIVNDRSYQSPGPTLCKPVYHHDAPGTPSLHHLGAGARRA